MRKSSVMVIAALLLLGSTGVYAQEELVARDILEITLHGGLAVPAGGISDWKTGPLAVEPTVYERPAETGWDAGIDLGYYVTPKFIAGFNFRYSQFGIDAPDSLAGEHHHRLFNPNIYLKYMWEGESDFVPYIKAHVGLENPKFSTLVLDQNTNQPKFRELSYDPAIAFGAAIGLFKYTADYSGVFVEAGYHMAMTEDVEGTYQGVDYRFGENTGVFTINAGVKLIVGSGD